jgi:hypothetical protein
VALFAFDFVCDAKNFRGIWRSRDDPAGKTKTTSETYFFMLYNFGLTGF